MDLHSEHGHDQYRAVSFVAARIAEVWSKTLACQIARRQILPEFHSGSTAVDTASAQ